ncbi:MAG: enoyl-CoA hydratase/isomerase family protein [Alphaproteobacteria bacterium]|nr:enoyl-CoA hydratase/isomerase family protein [Alphaproteobacteria bacterium]
MTYETLAYAQEDGVGILTLNRPQRRNAINDEMSRELGEIMPRLRDADDLGALILTGAGGGFCSGGEQSGKQLSPTQYRRRIQDFHLWLNELMNLEKPVIAAVDGPAYGAGFSLALASDFVLATPRARFCMVFARIGFVPDLSAMYLLPRIVGLQKAKDIAFTARAIDADEAKALRIVREIHAPDRLMDAAKDLARRLADGPTTALGLVKNGLVQSYHSDYRTMVEMEAYAQSVATSAPYHADALQRFLDKKPLAYNWDATARTSGKN